MLWTTARALSHSWSSSRPGRPRSAEPRTHCHRGGAGEDQIDDGQLHVVIAVNPAALAEADALDKETKRRRPLYGVIVLLKDNIATYGLMATTSGSLALAGVKATLHAFLGTRLRQAGMVIVDKANLFEWANLRATT